MADSKRKAPKLRFPGFNDDWEQRKLGDLLEERNDQTPETNEYPLMSFVQGKGVTPKGDRYNRSFLVKDENKKYKKTELGDFIYSSNNLETGSIGFNKTGKAVISPVYSIFKSKNEFESQFIGILSTRKDFIAKMTKFRQGVVYGQWRIHESDFLRINISIPSFKEQNSIIHFFKQLDNLITLHQRKLSDVQKLKSGLLQKMFPKNGEKVPEIRFPEFSDDWEQRKLGNHANILTGGTPKTTVPSYWEPKEIPWMSSGEVNKRRLIDTDNMISKEGLENSSARWVKKHSILIALAGQGKTRGTVAINDVALVTNQSIAAIEPDESLYYEFVFQNLSKRYDELRMISSGDGTRGGLNKKIISDIEISSPTIKEQREIGQFFKQLDDLITLHQRKLEHLQQQKKALLQQMFI
ncbi:restriction endonuclease subunit S [Leuconostoc lactis]|uniref:restriction endonuclease subunit S n=1 Tax=Leuconostoc lactis TaxID=1246 RepID=UPI0008153DF4|nr:restriction endonuclease subunit S [Leuconostoc lactis]ANY11860.1 hypothetical protein BCR17_05525 [Leuconostoc lactis]